MRIVSQACRPSANEGGPCTRLHGIKQKERMAANSILSSSPLLPTSSTYSIDSRDSFAPLGTLRMLFAVRLALIASNVLEHRALVSHYSAPLLI